MGPSIHSPRGRFRTLSLLAALTVVAPAAAPAQDASGTTTVQPGAPGEPTRVLEDESLDEAELPAYTEADVRFMRGMIRHHVQALEMTRLLRERTDREDLRRLALRIDISQKDEIALMERWLEQRDEDVPGSDSESVAADAPLMPGMLTERQMDELAAARGPAFDRLFLESMIRHHEGALRMVEELFRTPGAGQIPSVNHFASEVQADQQMEIRRMRTLLEDR